MIRFGVGALAEAPDLLRNSGFERYALLTTARAEELAPEVAGGAYVVAHVPPGPVPEAAAAVRERVNDRPLVALGGGRVIDSAKAIAGADGLRCAAIPTTLSGAEMTGFHRMPAGVDELRLVRPALVMSAPGLMASQPMPGIAASAMNALAHAVEALYTPLANPVAETAALRAAQLIADGLDEEPDQPSLALGALMAGYASGLAGYAVHHAVCQTIVRLCGTPHAQTNAVMLPHFVRMMEYRAREEIEKFGAAIGAEEQREGAADCVQRLAAKAEAGRLEYYGVDHDALERVAAEAATRPELRLNTPDPPGEGELLAVLERAL